ncbi:uncharacterized protein LOC132275143 [Cornus florida]|uniref:uncharacterized protein LOC132275143 n=1 Tax=Cornus florida TaxID=4283 RepID=UPI00289A43A1|nr:uncharacterized protein LOC132275143 [Cornus florida]
MVFRHLLENGMDQSYTIWYFHGENLSESPQHGSDVNDVEMPETYQMYRDIFFDGGDDVSDPNYEIREVEFKKKLEYAETPLFPECTKYTVMSAIVALYKHKATTNLSDTGFDGLLQMFGDMLPENNKLPKSYYETKIFLKTFDLGYEKIDAWPRQPGNDIDVYLEPLIDDLKELWEKGVEIYDAAKSTFNLKVILMWTISDFPAFSNLSGHVTKGKKACPTCSDDTCSRRLNCSTKTVYLGHRRWLSPTHPFRKKKSWFDGSEEHRWKPKILSGTEILHAMKNIKNDWGKKAKGKLHIKPKIGKRKQKTKKDENVAWKKKSIFFELPYWEVLLVRHNLDVIHIEKNICESIIGTLLNIKGKSKDGLKSRRDLEEMGIRGDLHPQDSKGKHFLPPAPHTLKKEEKQLFCKRLQQLKLPDGYSSNIGTHVSLDECKVVGLKSHDYHVLMQQLLPVALRGILPKGVRNAIFRLCAYFNEVCQRVIDRNSME